MMGLQQACFELATPEAFAMLELLVEPSLGLLPSALQAFPKFEVLFF